MPVITIPKNMPQIERFVAIPEKTYEEFLEWQKWIKSMRTFKPTAKDLHELARARKDFLAGDYIEWEDLKHELAHLRTRKSKKAD